MLTPTGVTAAEYWNAIKAGHPTHVRLTFTGQNIVLGDQDIEYNTGLTSTDILNGDVDLVFGRAVSKQVKFGFLNSSRLEGLDWEGEFTLEMGVDIGTPATTNWVQIGIFSGEKPNNVTTATVIDFTAYDRMKKFDILADDFDSTVTYPATVANIYSALCTFVGIQKVSGDELSAIMSRSYTEAPVTYSGYTCRDVLAWIAEACGCYARINSAGNVQMVWFTDNTSHVVTGDEEFHVESGDISISNVITVDQLLIKQVGSDLDVDYPSATGGNVYMIVENPFLSVSTASDITDYIKPLYDRLDALGGYLPVSVECVGSWLVEAGDIIEVSVFSETVDMPIFVKTMRWNGAIRDSYETTGQKQRNIYSSDEGKQRVISSNKIGMYVEMVEEEVDNNFYKKKNGITIDDNGVDIQGGKFVNLQSGNSYLKLTPTQMQFVGGSAQMYTPDGYYFYVNGFGFYKYPVQNNYNYNMRVVHGNTVPFELNVFGDSSYIKNKGTLILNPDGQTSRGVRIKLDGNYVVIYGDNGIKLGSSDSRYGDINYIYGDYIYYKHLQQSSSIEIKHDVMPLESVGDKLDKLKPVTFVYDDDKKEEKRIGLIYEDAINVMPEICSDDESEKAINYVELIPALLKEIQDLRARVKALEERIGD